MALNIKKNDTVVVIAGEERGKKGRVLAVNRRENRLMVEGLNMVKRHMKPSKKYTQGGIIEKEAPLHGSNVMLVCSRCGKPARVGYKVLENDLKVRTCRKCGEVMD